ncbi:hypothetical protein RclHR1_17040002 [Rhizophagus clarus]|nr:hypothetical protein RclHR1_17040002 [Rhizophagus clarus]
MSVPLVLLMLICPALDVAKIIIFDHTDGELKLYDIEYAYLSYSFLMVVILLCCTICIARGFNKMVENSVRSLSCFLPFIWISVLVIYTISTRNELGDIPFFCPQDYNYKSPTIRLACKIRAANLICMWSFTIYIMFFLIILLVLPSEDNNAKVDKVDKVYGRIEQVYSKDDDIDNEVKKDKSMNV